VTPAPARLLSVTALPSTRPDRVVVEVVGQVDAATAPLLEACLRTQASRVQELVVDLGRASFLGLAGARAVARARRLCRDRGARIRVREGGGLVLDGRAA